MSRPFMIFQSHFSTTLGTKQFYKTPDTASTDEVMENTHSAVLRRCSETDQSATLQSPQQFCWLNIFFHSHASFRISSLWKSA